MALDLKALLAAQKSKDASVAPADMKAVMPETHGTETGRISSTDNTTTNKPKPAIGGLNIKLGGLKIGSTQNSNAPVSTPVVQGNTGPTIVQEVSSGLQKDFNHPAMSEKYSTGEEQSFREALKILHDNFDNPELVANATRNILLALRQNSAFRVILLPEDCGLMVRALREGHGLVASSKLNNKTKRASNKQDIDNLSDMIFGSDFSVG